MMNPNEITAALTTHKAFITSTVEATEAGLLTTHKAGHIVAYILARREGDIIKLVNTGLNLTVETTYWDAMDTIARTAYKCAVRRQYAREAMAA